MRTLVLQLARFGDIYQTWPTLRALRRKFPDGELHVLVRARFATALEGFPGLIVHQLPTAEILGPVYNCGDIDLAQQELADFFAPLSELRFGQIVNLSFSPVSSYMTDLLATPDTVVRGYTRHSDGHLQIPDDPSAYFYAQVGVGRANRYHVTELFAAVAKVELTAEDFCAKPTANPRSGVVVHLGASSSDKIYPADLWVRALRTLRLNSVQTITLIGSQDERAISETVHRQLDADINIINLVGKTTLPALMDVIAGAQVVIGSDSAPIHMAALTATPVLNLSSRMVNFWETGPLTPGSRIFFVPMLSDLNPDLIGLNTVALLRGEPALDSCIERTDWNGPYQAWGQSFNDFSWQLIQALYSSGPYPALETKEDSLALNRLFELAELALMQLDRFINSDTRATASKILRQVDSLLIEVGRLEPRIDPLVQWFETQRLRIPPGETAATLILTRSLFEELRVICSLYRTVGNVEQEIKKARGLCRECVPELREYNVAAVHSSFYALVSTLVELARSQHLQKIDWALVLGELNKAVENGDWLNAADILEWKLEPAFAEAVGEMII